MTPRLAHQLHPNYRWAVEAKVLTWDEAHRLAAMPVWADEDEMDDETAALVRRYLYWLKTTDPAQ